MCDKGKAEQFTTGIEALEFCHDEKKCETCRWSGSEYCPECFFADYWEAREEEHANSL